jgi:hypothetical protein
MIKLRIDVDYPYPSRPKSFLYVALGIKSKKGSYLKNSYIIARMINESPRNVKAYWFFTPYTIPDQGLLKLLNQQRHELAIHLASRPFEEWKTLEKETGRQVKFYTIHGTSGKLARLIWRRKLKGPQVAIPTDFPLENFHNNKTFSIDRIRYEYGFEKILPLLEEWIGQGIVLSFHPEWLFKKNDKTHRGPVYDALRSVLAVDSDFEYVSLRRKAGVIIANDLKEYEQNIEPTNEFLEKLREQGVDIFTFLDRKWCCPLSNLPIGWVSEPDNVGLLEIKDYNSWWHLIGKKTRNMVRKAEKSGVKVEIVEPSDKLAEGIWRIYNETPIRQERAFAHYGESFELVRSNMYQAKNNAFVAACLEGELVGFIQILYGDRIAMISNILSLQRHWDKSVNNALLAKAVEVCALKGQRWLMYGRIGNHPSLDRFKENNGFIKKEISRIYIPLTKKGRIGIKIGLHQPLKDLLPGSLKSLIIPLLNWVSRTKIRIKLRLKKSK